jgi:hypothetical protein
MLFANRIASNFSSWEVASEDRREENSTVFVLLGLKDAALDRNLFPYLLGFREGIAIRPRQLRITARLETEVGETSIELEADEKGRTLFETLNSRKNRASDRY